MMIVAVAPSLLWPPKKPAGRPDGRTADSAQVRPTLIAPSAPAVARPSGRPTVVPADTGRTIWVTSPLYRLGFSSKGARLVSAELVQYQSFAPGDSGKLVQLVTPGDAFLRHRLVLPAGDTVALDDWDFQPVPDAPGIVVNAGQAAKPLRFEADKAGSHVTLEYRFLPEEYRFEG